jgi:hypothetical protein
VVLALIALGLAVVAGVRLGPPETAAHLPRALDPGADAGLVLLGAVLWLVVVPFWGRRTSGRFAASVVVKVLLVGVLASVTLGGAAPDLPFWSPAAAAVPYPSGPGEVQETVADFLAVPADHASLSSTEADFRAQFDERTAQLLTERLDAYPVAGDRVVAQAIGGLVAAGAVQRQASGSLGVPAGTATAAQQAAWQRLYRGLLTAHARTRASLATADPLLMAVHWELTGYVRPADRAPRAAEGMADLVRLGESVGTGPCAPGLQRSPATWQSQDGVPVDIVSRYVCPRS